jgi:hypothetical protein
MKLLNVIAKVVAPYEPLQSYSDNDTIIVVIRKPKPGSFGLIFDDTALMVDYRPAMSFRVQKGNLGLHKHLKYFRCELQFPSGLLKNYFKENGDNPYALEYVINRMSMRQDVETELTQVPPITTDYQDQEGRSSAIESLVKSAQPLDLLFSRPLQGSKVSALIRSIDRCQFSHVGTYIGDGMTVDAGPCGVDQNSIYELGKSSHMGLYRLRTPLSDKAKEMALNKTKELVGCDYNWMGVLEIYFRKKFRLPINPRRPSVGNLLFSDNFELINFV